MKLSEKMKEKQLLSFELFPPKTEKGMANLPGTIEHLMEFKPEYISCTYGAGGGNVGANREVSRFHPCNTFHRNQKYKRRYQRTAGSVPGRRG